MKEMIFMKYNRRRLENCVLHRISRFEERRGRANEENRICIPEYFCSELHMVAVDGEDLGSGDSKEGIR
jgi:hypothetical protein